MRNQDEYVALSPDTWRTIGLVLGVSLGGATIGNVVLDPRPDPFTGADAYRLCKQIEANMPPLEYRVKLRALEEHAREHGYVPPTPQVPLSYDICNVK